MSADDTPPSPSPIKQPDRELLEQIYTSVERTRKMFLWTTIITIITFVLPLLGLIFAIPFILNTYLSPITDTLGL